MGHFRKHSITFMLTPYCNMECDYCYVSEKYKQGLLQPKVFQPMDINFAKAGIDDFFSTTDSRHLRFFTAGEITTQFSLLKKIVDYARQHPLAEHVKTEIQTNGYFGRSIRDWLADNMDIIWVSWDGPGFLHNSVRKTKYGSETTPVIEKNIRYLAERGKGLTAVRTTISPLNNDHQKEVIDYAISMGVKAVSVWACPTLTYTDPATNEQRTLEMTLKDFADRFLDAHQYAEQKNFFYTSIYTTNFDEPVSIACRAMIPSPHLTFDGYVSCCDMANSGDTPLQVLLYGKFNQTTKKIEYDQKKINVIKSRNTDELAGCSGCDILDNCAGGCVGEVIESTGDILGKNMFNCELTQYLGARMQRNVNRYPYLFP